MDYVRHQGRLTPVPFAPSAVLRASLADLEDGYYRDRTEAWLDPPGRCAHSWCRAAWRLRGLMEAISAELQERHMLPQAASGRRLLRRGRGRP